MANREGFWKMNTDILTEADYSEQFKARERKGDTSALHAIQQYLDQKLRGARVRARVHCVEAEEKPTIKFYRDVTKYAIDRRIRAVCDVHGTVQKDPLDIVEVFKTYEQLYTRADVEVDLQGSLLDNIDKTPSKEQNDGLGSPLTVDELWKAVAKMKGGKAPGSDGIPVEFYKRFWGTVGHDLRDVFASAFLAGSLSPSQRTGVITLLPKSGDPLEPKNKRPITLLNVDYKILAKTLCNRLGTVMPDLVGSFQTCAVREHSIQQNLWLMRDLVEYVMDRDLPLNPLQEPSKLNHCFDPFTYPVEPKVKCLQYADDVTCVVSDLASFRALTGTLSTFQRAIGARLNPTKTKGLRLGKWRSKQLPFAASWVDDAIKINGIWFGYGSPESLTWNEKVDLVEASNSVPHSWRPTKAYCQMRETLRIMSTVGDVLQSSAGDQYRAIFDDLVGQVLPNGYASGPEVWRVVHSRSLDHRRRDLLWRIAHDAIVTNLKRLRWCLGDGICPRTGCTRWESVPHVFWQCGFVAPLWEWFQALADRLTFCNTWAVSQDYALYGLSPPPCNTSVRGIITFVSASIKLALWRDRCNIVFRGEGKPADVVLALVRTEIKLRVEADFVRLPRSTFGRVCTTLINLIHPILYESYGIIGEVGWIQYICCLDDRIIP
ncbi:hypothetical protein HOLleu_10986 [Holothuria leucospilota]|uniref:Reverse transcriptase domain-containing protein n=1 Tax=Holothuria leucospilota TaxID=206669 RepID=A0A9Q1CFG9_HOLLE|nr:hypothetical protein HOLleu_10986 [Holothuria leucospilota]